MTERMVTCYACDGDGSTARRVSLTSNPNAHCDVIVEDCGLCGGSGEITADEFHRTYSYPYGGLTGMVRSSMR